MMEETKISDNYALPGKVIMICRLQYKRTGQSDDDYDDLPESASLELLHSVSVVRQGAERTVHPA
jgi:hypothetical protein